MDYQLGRDFKRVAFGMTRRHWWGAPDPSVHSCSCCLTRIPPTFIFPPPLTMFLSLIAMKNCNRLVDGACVLQTWQKVRSTCLWRVLLVYYADRHGHDDQDVQESCGKHPHPQHAVQLKTRSHWRHHIYPPPPIPLLLLTLFDFTLYFYSIPKFCSLLFSLRSLT